MTVSEVRDRRARTASRNSTHRLNQIIMALQVTPRCRGAERVTVLVGKREIHWRLIRSVKSLQRVSTPSNTPESFETWSLGALRRQHAKE
jgi:hypothetical protein